ncbi:polysaccharide pyruvyl transferase CsaB [Oceanobacillus halotolerans]|uniref:polysaccharide pyruvyl transferase CsaB n=1 Tax=Oceanobacillus halotolerans TaxID=2663380 RepID=UPI0013D90EC8|nr:polysaccharide pyruvyl transferase CsaB [Oceanobacillus halotolerans]
MHVVLSGYYGFDNVGDEAILLSIIQSLRKIQPDIDITVLSNNPNHTQNAYQVKAVNRWRLNEVRRIISQSDGLISGGGSLLQDETGMKTIPYYTGIIKIAKWYKKPVFIYAQGMGPFNKPLSRWMVRTTLNKVHGITVRDEDSKALLTTIGVKKVIQVVPDPVIGLDNHSFTSSWLNGQELSSDFITVSVRDWSSSVPYLEKIAQSLDQLAQKGYAIVFIPMHGKIDEKVSRKTASYMHAKSFIAPGEASIEEKIAVISESNLLIGMRLHSLIFSAISYTPFVALSYDPKIDAFANICSLPVAGHVEKEDWSGDSLTISAMELLATEYAQLDSLKRLVTALRQGAQDTAALAIKTLNAK